jgi:hypothetical protein
MLHEYTVINADDHADNRLYQHRSYLVVAGHAVPVGTTTVNEPEPNAAYGNFTARQLKTHLNIEVHPDREDMSEDQFVALEHLMEQCKKTMSAMIRHFALEGLPFFTNASHDSLMADWYAAWHKEMFNRVAHSAVVTFVLAMFDASGRSTPSLFHPDQGS